LEASHGRRLQRLAEQIAAAGVERNFKTVLFTSVYRAEGRTTLVLAVARALARLPGKTVLVDADLTAPTLSRALALVPRPGLEDAVEGGEPLDKVLVESSQEHLVVLTLRAPVAHPKRFLANPQWACLMARLRREFDSVLLDGGPLFSGLSATVLHRPVDAAVLVFHRSLTSERAMRRASQALEAAGIPLFGLAETFTD
jgi:Mrp family chromosome partitioning ATPase